MILRNPQQLSGFAPPSQIYERLLPTKDNLKKFAPEIAEPECNWIVIGALSVCFILVLCFMFCVLSHQPMEFHNPVLDPNGVIYGCKVSQKRKMYM